MGQRSQRMDKVKSSAPRSQPEPGKKPGKLSEMISRRELDLISVGIRQSGERAVSHYQLISGTRRWCWLGLVKWIRGTVTFAKLFMSSKDLLIRYLFVYFSDKYRHKSNYVELSRTFIAFFKVEYVDIVQEDTSILILYCNKSIFGFKNGLKHAVYWQLVYFCISLKGTKLIKPKGEET